MWHYSTNVVEDFISGIHSTDTAVGRKFYLGGGGGGHDKENSFERHYFLRLQKQFSEKWGGGDMPPGSYGTDTATKNLLIKRSQFLINGLSKNSYTMYRDCLACLSRFDG